MARAHGKSPLCHTPWCRPVLAGPKGDRYHVALDFQSCSRRHALRRPRLSCKPEQVPLQPGWGVGDKQGWITMDTVYKPRLSTKVPWACAPRSAGRRPRYGRGYYAAPFHWRGLWISTPTRATIPPSICCFGRVPRGSYSAAPMMQTISRPHPPAQLQYRRSPRLNLSP